MTYIQLVQPVLTVKAQAGWCLWFSEEVNTSPHLYRSAWEAYLAAQYKHSERAMPNVSVPVWFSHYGTYGTPPTYGNWGHVVQWVPERNAFLSVIGVGYGQQWFNTLEQVEKYFNAKYVGWTEDIATKRIVKGDDMVDDASARAMLQATTLLAQNGTATPRQPTKQEVENLIGRTTLDALNQIMTYSAWKNNLGKVVYYDQDVAAAAQKNYKYVGDLFGEKYYQPK